MALEKQNVLLWRGDAKTLVFDVINADGTVPDLTGATLTWVLAATSGSPAIVTKTGTIASGTTSRVQIALSKVDMEQTPGTYYHELRAGAPIDDVLATGQFVINGSISG